LTIENAVLAAERFGSDQRRGFVVGQFDPGNRRDAEPGGFLAGRDLVAEKRITCARGPMKAMPAAAHSGGELVVLRQEAVAGMDGIDSCPPRHARISPMSR